MIEFRTKFNILSVEFSSKESFQFHNLRIRIEWLEWLEWIEWIEWIELVRIKL